MREKTWGTKDERYYVSRLNQTSLEKYLASADLRQDWPGIDRDEILGYAKTRLAKMTKPRGLSMAR